MHKYNLRSHKNYYHILKEMKNNSAARKYYLSKNKCKPQAKIFTHSRHLIFLFRKKHGPYCESEASFISEKLVDVHDRLKIAHLEVEKDIKKFYTLNNCSDHTKIPLFDSFDEESNYNEMVLDGLSKDYTTSALHDLELFKINSLVIQKGQLNSWLDYAMRPLVLS
ncbi:hypothetical protein BY996DRAFT_6422181 [Phakopsora pachyrhizi]|nr:hypothetical protein BY996DRAFT_6422181 [Phakopsora pachyrhizi]